MGWRTCWSPSVPTPRAEKPGSKGRTFTVYEVWGVCISLLLVIDAFLFSVGYWQIQKNYLIFKFNHIYKMFGNGVIFSLWEVNWLFTLWRQEPNKHHFFTSNPQTWPHIGITSWALKMMMPGFVPQGSGFIGLRCKLGTRIWGSSPVTVTCQTPSGGSESLRTTPSNHFARESPLQIQKVASLFNLGTVSSH